MGLCIFSGPKWEDDTLNDINEVSIALNTRDMFEKRKFMFEKRELECDNKNKSLPNMLR